MQPQQKSRVLVPGFSSLRIYDYLSYSICGLVPSDSSGQKMSFQNFFRPGQAYEWVLENLPQ